MLRSVLKLIQSLLISTLILLVFLEIASLVYIHFFNTSLPRPTYSFFNLKSYFWSNNDVNFGVWHEPNSSFVHRKSCFRVKYHTNEFGMRDASRTLKSEKARAVVLGDSFTEGWGLKTNDRLSNILEQKNNQEFLNFGTAGGFGTIQEWLLYKHLAKQFDHNVVLWQLLPFNDFDDNNCANSPQYRPYLTGEYPNYTLAYSQPALPKSSQDTLQASDTSTLDFIWKNFVETMREWSALYQVIKYVGYFFENPAASKFSLAEEARLKSMFYDFSEKDWLVMRYTIEQLMQEAKGKQVVIFAATSPVDFMRYAPEVSPLSAKLFALAEELNFTYVDMLPLMHAHDQEYAKYYFTCDHHWNSYANEVAAGILEPYVNEAFAKSLQ